MLRPPQQLALQLSVAPTRRTLTTAATSYHADKPPPPPVSSPASGHTRASASASSQTATNSPTSTASSSSTGTSSSSLSSSLSSSSTSSSAASTLSAASSAASTAVAALRVLRLTADTASIAAKQHQEIKMASQRARDHRPAPLAPASQVRSHSEERTPTTAEEISQAQAQASQSRSRAFFPLGYKDAVHQWWHNSTSATAERSVLSYVPFLREAKAGSQPDLTLNAHQQLQQQEQADVALSASHSAGLGDETGDVADPYGSRLWRSQMVPLSGKNRSLNEYSIERVAEETTDTLVMLHGYGAGLGFFYRNFEPLSRLPGWQLYALDMLGMGNSSRPTFKVHSKDPKTRTVEAENWFVDALEEWRKIRKIERFTLLGHSLGGYLAVSYALKYPGHLNKLILASPVGVPEDPYGGAHEADEPEQSTIAAEFAQDQSSVASAPSSAKSNGTPPAVPGKRTMPGWFVWLWEANVSPFTVVRASGPLGPRLVSGWTSRRFSHLPAEEAAALHTYSYNLFRQRGSGEYALTYLLAPGAYARSPVIRRIQEVGRQVLKPAQPATETSPAVPAVRETGFPIVMLYGDHDWMDVGGGYAAQQKIQDRIEKVLMNASPDEQAKENGSAKVVVVRNAGHHLYLDNPDEFNRVIKKEMEDTQAYEQREREKQKASMAAP